MAYRGFKYIEHLFVTKNCKLIRAPSVSSNTKSSKAYVIETKRIASLRIHVERVIRRIREIAFHHHILKVGCGIINLQPGVISGK